MTDIGSRLTKALEGRYTVERELGHGGMATVHLAADVKHGRKVAIKVLRPELAQALGGERFLREINIAAKLQSPHILPLLDSGEADGLLYYVMPYVEGESLRSLLVERRALPPSEAMRLLHDIVDGLAHAHRQGIMHRDIKPDNVMLADRHALVVDFGIAKAVSDASAHHDLTSIGISLGTPAYMAPEQAAADPAIDHRADIYSVGAMAYEMLTGAPPFTGSPQAIIAAQISTAPRPLSQARPEVPAAVVQIVMRCLEKDPAARFQTADDLLHALDALVTPSSAAAAASPPGSRSRRWTVRGSAILVIAVGASFMMQRVQRDRWVQGTALPELRRLVEANEQDSAYAIALQVEAVAPRDSTLTALWPRFARKSIIESEPAGARVYRASLADTSVRHYLGATPVDSVWLPSRVGLFRFELEGHRTVLRLDGSRPGRTLLDATDAPDAEMVRIPGGLYRAFLVGTDGIEPVELGAFQMDRFEISNAQYQAFVDAGGYRDESFWEHPIRDGARTIPWSEAMARFVDGTGRPGPATWEAGGFPAGTGDLPVGGVSWYEAAAYAKFAGKSLPTLYHWARAAGVQHSKYVVPLSNLEGAGPRAVGAPRGVSVMGVSDMAGNVREWVFNDAGRSQRFIPGGGWSDPTYGFVDAYAQRPLDRSPINGIRLVRYAADEPNLAAASAPIARAFRDYARETPVPNAVFAGYRQIYDYDPIALSPTVESVDSTASMLVERVSFAAAYGGERMFAWIYKPRVSSGALQTVVYYPGSGSINGGPSAGVFDGWAEWIVRSGRAFVVPIYKSTHERSDSLRSDYADMSIFYRDHVVMWAKDYRRTLDYLSTRSEFDSTRFAYFGVSWGGLFGGLIPAVEPRIKAVVLYVAGLAMEGARPEVDIVNFLPRVRQPVLMLNGRYDYFFPLETAQQPFFRLLGTPAADKRYLVYDGGHDVPRTELIKESLAWFDKYLGPVR